MIIFTRDIYNIMTAIGTEINIQSYFKQDNNAERKVDKEDLIGI